MSRAQQILAELASRGVSIAAEGNRLRLHPRSALTEGLITRVLGAKREILALLRTAPPAAQPHPPAPPLPVLQWWVLWLLAQTPKLSRTALYSCTPAPRPAVDQALAALVDRRELRAERNGLLDLNAC
jgi:TubC N-terminal docking domain